MFGWLFSVFAFWPQIIAVLCFFIGIFYFFVFYLPDKIFYTDFLDTPQPDGATEIAPKNVPAKDHFVESSHYFTSEGVECRGDLYLPFPTNRNKKYPCIVLGHGFTATRDMELFNLVRKMYEINNNDNNSNPDNNNDDEDTKTDNRQNGDNNNNNNSNKFEFAIFVFDYRYFGESKGLPRHYVSPHSQCVDYINGLRFLTKKFGGSIIDCQKFILMGISFSGGHVLNICGNNIFNNIWKKINANDNIVFNICCVISVIPFIGEINNKLNELTKKNDSDSDDSDSSMIIEKLNIEKPNKWEEYQKRGILKAIIIIYGMICDIIRNQIYEKVYGNGNMVSNSNNNNNSNKDLYALIWQSKFEKYTNFGIQWIEDSFKSAPIYWAKHPRIRKGDWRNAILLRSVWEMIKYKPINFVENIDIPTLYIVAENDKMCPSDRIKFAANLTKNSKVFGIDMKHYEWYFPHNVEKIIEKQFQFIKCHI